MCFVIKCCSQTGNKNNTHNNNNNNNPKDSILYSGIVVDKHTKENLPYTKIYVNRDTVYETSNDKGEFQVYIEIGTALQFHKSGYKWQTFRINNDALKIVELTKSDSIWWYTGPGSEDLTEIIYDGKLIDKSEWKDLNRDEIHLIQSVILSDGGLGFIMKSRE